MMITNFEHRPSAHCETGVTSNILNFYGCKLSESMIFGLGEGLSFIYIPFIPFKGNALKFSFRTVPGSVFARALKKLGVKIGVKRFTNKEEAMKEMDNLLAQGIPVGNVVGMYHLPHSPYRTHFNAHTLCVVGKEGDEYTISDPSWHTTLLKISYSDLMRVRFPAGAFKPNGKMFWIKEKPVIGDISHLIEQSIQKTCKKMLGIPFVSYFGVAGIVTMSKRMRKLEKRYGEKDARVYLASLIQAIEEIGTGGAGYRFMYGLFLHEAAEILNKPKLKDFSIEMTRIGDLWRLLALECGRKIKNRSEVSYNDLADKVVEIAAAEKKFFLALKKEKLEKNNS
ncbi:MAG: BtrH N-terminal domain-containing protein [Prevotellaceae bacterium]|jgi:hypothetical protein|nr:BtrH N-terminal domain-containing protein [Prevotellaceae bacterium]